MKLIKLKRPGESFSDLLDRLADKEETVVAFIKTKGTMDFGEETKSLVEEIFDRRKIQREGEE